MGVIQSSINSWTKGKLKQIDGFLRLDCLSSEKDTGQMNESLKGKMEDKGHGNQTSLALVRSRISAH